MPLQLKGTNYRRLSYTFATTRDTLQKAFSYTFATCTTRDTLQKAFSLYICHYKGKTTENPFSNPSVGLKDRIKSQQCGRQHDGDLKYFSHWIKDIEKSRVKKVGRKIILHLDIIINTIGTAKYL